MSKLLGLKQLRRLGALLLNELPIEHLTKERAQAVIQNPTGLKEGLRRLLCDEELFPYREKWMDVPMFDSLLSDAASFIEVFKDQRGVDFAFFAEALVKQEWVSPEDRCISVVKTTLYNLGLEGTGITLEHVKAALVGTGWSLCPKQVGPALMANLCVSEIQFEGVVVVGMEPLYYEDDKGASHRMYKVSKSGDKMRFSTESADPGRTYNPHDEWVFVQDDDGE